MYQQLPLFKDGPIKHIKNLPLNQSHVTPENSQYATKRFSNQ